jgi:predicted DCC family thiol-disulfide oxidoreductase YuxK
LPGEHFVLYDADCGVCRWVMARVLAWDTRRALRPVALQDPVAPGLLPGMSDEERAASWHLVTPHGERYSAGRAVAPLLRLLPYGRPLAAVASAAQPLTDRAYAFAAARRGVLGRLVGEGAKRRAAERIRERTAAQRR